jgi:hypothetical protein
MVPYENEESWKVLPTTYTSPKYSSYSEVDIPCDNFHQRTPNSARPELIFGGNTVFFCVGKKIQSLDSCYTIEAYQTNRTL